jgi:hypothetical protein
VARTYKRDASGRFAGGGGGGGSRAKPVTLTRRKPVSQGGGKSRGHLLKRQAVKDAKGKLAAKDPADRTIKGQLSRRSQKGAVTRAQRQLKAVQQSGSVRLKARAGALRVGARKMAAAAPAKPAVASRPDQAVVNIPMRGKRGKALERDIDRAVAITKAAERAKMKPADQVRRDTKRLKALRAANEPEMIAKLKKRTGRPAAEIRSAIRARTPSQEIALIRRWVGENRNNSTVVGSRRARADKARAPKPPPNSNAAILKVRAKQLRDMKARGAHYSEITMHQIKTMDIRNQGLGLGVRRR